MLNTSTKAARTLVRGVLATLGFVLAVAAFHASAANAVKIANPSDVPGGKDFVAAITGGYVQINGQGGIRNTFSLNFGELIPGQPDPRPKLRGTISSNGDLVIPKSQVTFPAITFPVDAIHSINVTFVATDNWVGSIDPLTGKVKLTAKLMITLAGDAGIATLDPATCHIGDDQGHPVTITAQTHIGDNLRQISYVPDESKGPPTVLDPTAYLFPGGLLTGQGYSDELGVWPTAPEPFPAPAVRPAGWAPQYSPRAAGSFRAVDDTLSVPASNGCLGSAADGTINNLLGLPANAPNQRASFDIAFVPGAGREGANALVQKGVKSNFTAPGISTSTWPSTEVPQLPTQVPLTIDASTSTYSGTPNAAGRYRFDLGDGNGYGAWTNTATASVPTGFTTTGTRTIRVQARDSDGDIDTKTRTLEVVPSSDMSITKTTVTSAFRAGSNGAYKLDVHNNSLVLANSQPVTVSDTLPTGTSLTSLDATGWACTTSSTAFTCKRGTGTIAQNASSIITANVAVASSAPATVSNTATVQQFGDPNTSNDASTVNTPVHSTDLTVNSTHDGDFPANGMRAYTVQVKNVGNAETVGSTTVVDTLPAGFTYLPSGSGGSGWTCTAGAGNTVSCVTPASIAGGADATPITIRVKVGRSVTGTFSNAVNVTTADDLDKFGGANATTDPTTVVVVPDLTIHASHSPATFVVGSTVHYAIQVTNESIVDVDGPTTVAYDLPTGLTLAEAPTGTGWDCAASTDEHVSCVYDGTIAGDVGNAVDAPLLDVPVHVSHAAYPSASVDLTVANEDDGNASNDATSDTATVTRVDVSITKRVDQSNFSVGIPGTYKIAVKNEGDADTVGPVTVVDDLPSTLNLEEAGGAGWSCATPPVDAPRHVRCVRNATLAAGASAPELVITVTVTDAAAEGGTVTNTATVATPRDDASVEEDAPVTGNNSSTYSVAAISVDIAVTELGHGTPLRVGAPGEYSVKVANVGAIPTATGEPVTLTVDLPAGVTPGTVVPARTGWVCDDVTVSDAHRITCVKDPGAGNAALPAKTATSTATFSIPVTVDDSAPATGDTVATVSTLKDSNAEKSPNNVRHDAITAINRIDLALHATAPTAPLAGHDGRYVVQVTNPGTAATVAPSTVSLTLPDGAAFNSSKTSGTGWNCGTSTNGGTDVSCTRTASLTAGATAPALSIWYAIVASPPAETWTQAFDVATSGEPATRLANNHDTVASALRVVDFSLTKSHVVGNIHAGRNAIAKLVVKNVGNATSSSSSSITVTDKLDATKLTALSASGTGWRCAAPQGNELSCTYLATAAAGETLPPITTVFTARADATDDEFDSLPLAKVTSNEDARPGNDSAADPTKVIVAADLSVTQQASGSEDASVAGGRPATDAYDIRNVGAVAASDVTVDVGYTDGIGVGAPISASSDWTCAKALLPDANPVAGHPVHARCTLDGDLASDDSSRLALIMRPTTSGTGPQSSSLVAFATGDVNDDNNRFERAFTITAPDLAVSTLAVESYTATEPADALLSGKTATYSAKIENVGNETTTGNISATFDLPAGAGFTDSPTTANYGADWKCRLTGARVSCDYDGSALPPNGTTTLRVPVTPNAVNAPTITPKVTVITEDDGNAANDSKSVTDKVVNPPKEDVPVETTPTTPTTPTPPAPGATAISGKLVKGGITLGSLPQLDLAAGQLVVSGTISSSGALVLPKEKVKFATISVDAGSVVTGATAKVILSAAGDGTGTLPPAGGTGSVKLPVIAKIEVYASTGSPLLNLGASSNCTVGPIDFDLSGPYNGSTKLGTFANTAVSVPGAGAGCGAIGGTLSTAIGIPSATNKVSLDIQFAGGDGAVEDPVPDPPKPSAPVAKEGTIKVSSSSVAVSAKGKASVKIACSSAAAIDACSAGKLSLKAKVKSKKKKGKKTVTVTKTVVVGSASYGKLAAGKSATVVVSLNKTGKKLAKPGKKFKVSSVLQSSVKGAKAVTGSVTLKYAKAKKAAKKTAKKK